MFHFLFLCLAAIIAIVHFFCSLYLVNIAAHFEIFFFSCTLYLEKRLSVMFCVQYSHTWCRFQWIVHFEPPRQCHSDPNKHIYYYLSDILLVLLLLLLMGLVVVLIIVRISSAKVKLNKKKVKEETKSRRKSAPFGIIHKHTTPSICNLIVISKKQNCLGVHQNTNTQHDSCTSTATTINITTTAYYHHHK